MYRVAPFFFDSQCSRAYSQIRLFLLSVSSRRIDTQCCSRVADFSSISTS